MHIGTTVSVTNIFENFPVRLKEWKKNFRREYAKCLELVQAYALISAGVRVSFVHANKGYLLNALIELCINRYVVSDLACFVLKELVPASSPICEVYSPGSKKSNLLRWIKGFKYRITGTF